MKDAAKLLDLAQKKETIALTKNEKKIINYLLSLHGKRLFVERMSKEIDMAKETIYNNLGSLEKRNIIRSSWKLNPFALGFKIIELEAFLKKSNPKAIAKLLSKHPAISKVTKCFHNNLRIDIIVQHIDDYKEIERYLVRIGLKPVVTRIIVEQLHET